MFLNVFLLLFSKLTYSFVAINFLMVESTIAALRELSWGYKLLASGEFNADIAQPEGEEWDEDITTTLAAAGLEDMSEHLLPRQCPWCWYRRTWSMVRLGREVRSWADYILGMNRNLFRNVSALGPRNNSNHYMILGCLQIATLREHTKYLGRCTRLPLWTLTTPSREDGIFTALRREIPKPKAWEARKKI